MLLATLTERAAGIADGLIFSPMIVADKVCHSAFSQIVVVTQWLFISLKFTYTKVYDGAKYRPAN